MSNMFAMLTKLTESFDILSTWSEMRVKVNCVKWHVEVSSPGSPLGENGSKVDLIGPSLTREK